MMLYNYADKPVILGVVIINIYFAIISHTPNQNTLLMCLFIRKQHALFSPFGPRDVLKILASVLPAKICDY